MKLVVGSRLSAFAETVDAVTTDRVLQQFTSGDIPEALLLGQGVNDQDASVIKLLGSAIGVPVVTQAVDDRRAGRTVTHKHHIQSGLISIPRRIDTDLFESDVLVDDRNEIMSDHLTGCHLQGMLLIEAVRQMFIAVAEVHYGDIGVPSNGHVVFDRLDVRFEQFAFPIATTIRQTTTAVERKRTDRTRFVALLEVFQADARVAVADVSYTVFEAAALQPKEVSKAKAAVAAAILKARNVLQATPVTVPTEPLADVLVA